jgi:hypothetical protein
MMNWFSYEIDLVNPTTNEETSVTVSITELQRARAKRSPDWMRSVQQFAQPLLPSGFMPIGGRVRGVS